jgi:mxaL protein
MIRGRLSLVLAALLLLAALFEPGMPAPSARVEHLVVLDITQSMNVPDAPGASGGAMRSRLDAAKAALAAAVQELPCGSKLGWAVFSEYRAFVLLAPVEVCGNRNELLATLQEIDGRMAWTGNSEVAKALNSSLRAARELVGKPSVVFVSDGHEAPPVNPRYRPAFDDGLRDAGVTGLIVGVGGDTPLPIPKTDPSGRPLGHWRADEVLQTDPRSLGRGGSVRGEQMVDDQDNVVVPPLPGATPGREHLSSLRESYLRLLASETGLGYHRLQDAGSLLVALTDASLRRPRPGRLDLRPWLGGAALLAVLLSLGGLTFGNPRTAS